MAYRRKQGGITKFDNDGSSSSNSLAAQAIRASSAHRDSSLSSAYGNSAFDSNFKDRPKASSTYDYTSMKSTNEPGGLWGVLARKAKGIVNEDKVGEQSEKGRTIPTKSQKLDTSPTDEVSQSDLSTALGSSRKIDSPRLRKGFNAITSSLNHIGDSIGTAFEEGRSIMEHKTADIIQETRKFRRQGSNAEEYIVSKEEQETLLKASRDVAMATAAKAKLLLREVKTLKADLTFAKKRCSQLEEENRGLRENGGSGNPTDDDDLIRLQLETLLAEKARLAHENSLYARENRFLREIVEYHQLTMQDVIYIDENIEEVTEVNPLSRTLSTSPSSPNSPPHVSHIQLQQETPNT